MYPACDDTRRLALTGTLAAGLLGFAAAPANASPSSRAEEMASSGEAHPFVHVFSFKWKEAATAADRERAVRAIRDLRHSIADIRQLWLGENVSEKSPGYTTTGVMFFENQQAYHAYTTHAAHTQLLQWLAPLIAAVELDFKA